MKKIIIASFVLMAVAAACTHKAAPTATPAAATSGIPAMSSASTAQADIDAGHAIFTSNTKCAKCHGAKDKYVTSHTYAEATGVLNAMSKKAGLSQDEINQLAAYVNSVAKK